MFAFKSIYLCLICNREDNEDNNIITYDIRLFMLFDGNWISLDKVPVYWRWVRYVSFMGVGSQAAIVNEYTGLEFKNCDSDSFNSTVSACYSTGEGVLYISSLYDIDV